MDRNRASKETDISRILLQYHVSSCRCRIPAVDAIDMVKGEGEREQLHGCKVILTIASTFFELLLSDTWMSVWCLASVLDARHDFQHALAVYQRGVSGYKRIFGTEHPTTVACGEDLSSLLRWMELSPFALESDWDVLTPRVIGAISQSPIDSQYPSSAMESQRPI